MTQTNLSPQTKEIISRLYSSNEYNKREAIYRILFDRRTDLLPELKKAVKYEKNETIAVFMVQVCLTLTNFPRDSVMERRILEIMQYEEGGKVNDLTPTMWKYLENCATSQMIIAILASMGNSIPANSYDFIEMCLTHPDPEIRALVCEKAIKSGRPSHFAYVLNLVADKDPVVSQTAFMAIKNLPEVELSIILDYALGSPDEWVLNTVAPFLPNLITNNLRSVIAKVQYHSNQNVAHKAREALKVLDAIPYITKRSLKDHDEAEKRKAEEKEKVKKEEQIEESKKLSMKEQLEQKRKEQEEKERKIREANEALDKELASIDSSEMEEFAKVMDNYDSVLPTEEKAISKDELELPEEKKLVENLDFSVESDALSEIDENSAEEAVSDIVTKEQEDEQAFLDAMAAVKEKEEIANKSTEQYEPVPTPPDNMPEYTEQVKIEDFDNKVETNVEIDLGLEKEAESKAELFQAKDEEIDFDFLTSNSTNSENKAESAVSIDLTDSSALENSLQQESAPAPEIENSLEKESDSLNLDNASQFLDADSLDLGTFETSSEKSSNLDFETTDFNFDETMQNLDDVNISQVDFTSIDLASEAKSIKNSEKDLKSTVKEAINEAIVETKEAEKPENAGEKRQNQQETVLSQKEPQNTIYKIQDKNKPNKETASKISSTVAVPSSTKDIFEKYPSFLTDPLLEVFKASTDEAKLKAIDKVLTNLTAFLNVCFLQSCMYYAQESEMLTKSIKDCIKGNLTGPSSIRCLHNFVLAMKSVRGSNVFFTFQLAKVMGNSQDETNPLMLMRELKEFLREPEEPFDESLPQAIDGLIEILRGVRYITMNTLVMRAPRGAKLPYADLSGPLAKPLPPEKRPSMDLPVSEVILISTDGAEAFGLFPFFKYQNKKVIYTIPTSEELATFYERLEITP